MFMKDNDIVLIRNSLQAVLDAVSLMRMAVDDRTRSSFDNLIMVNLDTAITLLDLSKQEYEYQLQPDVYEEVLRDARAAEAAEVPSLKVPTGKGKKNNGF